jgi:chitodextrinase
MMHPTRPIFFFLLWQISAQCLSAQALYEVAPLPFNTSYADEVAAVSSASGLIYCANSNQNIIFGRKDQNDEYLFQLYAVQKDGSEWGASAVLYKGLMPNAHKGTGSMSADGKTLYFTANNKQVNGIFIAQKSGNAWANVRPFVHNSAKYKVAHPSLSGDGKRLFFASDMPGGFGGFDIYSCEWTANGWSKPNNLGEEVNSAGNELYPFIQGNGVLFFSSTGHGSMGGLDIFLVHQQQGKWTARQQLEAPVNSNKDDFAYIASDKIGSSGYFSTNRSGKTVDIFSFKSLSAFESVFPVFAECKEQEENDYTFVFEPTSFRVDTFDTEDVASYYYEWDFGDGAVVRGEKIEHSFASPGVYMVQLNVVDTLTGELESRAADYKVEVTDIEQPYITVKETATAGEKLTLDAHKTYLPNINIEEYYWMLGDGTTIQGASVTHSYTTSGIYQITLGVMGTHKKTGKPAGVCIFRNVVID